MHPTQIRESAILWFWPKPEFQSEFKLRIYILHKRLELLLHRWKFFHRYFNSLKFLRLDLDVSESFIFLSNFLLVNDLAIFYLSSLHLSPFCQSYFTNAFKSRGLASLLSRLTASWFQKKCPVSYGTDFLCIMKTHQKHGWPICSLHIQKTHSCLFLLFSISSNFLFLWLLGCSIKC